MVILWGKTREFFTIENKWFNIAAILNNIDITEILKSLNFCRMVLAKCQSWVWLPGPTRIIFILVGSLYLFLITNLQTCTPKDCQFPQFSPMELFYIKQKFSLIRSNICRRLPLSLNASTCNVYWDLIKKNLIWN